MDASTAFVNMVASKYPDVRVYQSDIRQPLRESDAHFDTVFCIRTLPPIEGIPEILAEMVRITKPGGLVIFDYGKHSAKTSIGGVEGNTSHYDIPTIIEGLPVKLVKTIPVNGFFSAVIKSSRFLNRLFSSSYNVLPMSFYVAVEKLSARITASGVFYILQKEG